MKNKVQVYDPEKVKQLSEQYPDTYWRFHADSGYGMINPINSNYQLQTLPNNIHDHGPITGMTLSDDGKLLATFCNMGSIKVWDIDKNFNLMRNMRDASETQIEEFYCGQFLAEHQLLVAGGKLKARHKWSYEDNDNFILGCDIKIFNVETCECVAVLKGHSEEILCIKAVSFKGNNYFISTSQDGYIIKWHMDESWT
jgi:WD40 repeat protein